MIMRHTRLKIYQVIAVIVVVGLALFSSILSLPHRDTASRHMNVPPQPVQAVNFDRPRPEIRIERMLEPDEFTGFDPAIASLLKPGPDREAPLSAQREQAGDEIASLTCERRGGGER